MLDRVRLYILQEQKRFLALSVGVNYVFTEHVRENSGGERA